MKIEKLREREAKLAEQVEAAEKKLAKLKDDYKAVRKAISEAEEAEILAYVRGLKLSPADAKDIIRRFAEAADASEKTNDGRNIDRAQKTPLQGDSEPRF